MPNPFTIALESAFGSATSAVASAANEAANFITKIDQIVARWEAIKDEWDKIFQEQDVEETLNNRVVTVSAAQTVLEDLKIENLKARAETIYNDIKDLIQLVLHPLGGSEQGDQALLAGAAAYSGRAAPTGAFKAASLLNTALAFGDNVLKIEDKIVDILKLLDIIEDMKKGIEDAELPQKNNQISVDGKRTRV
jgi:hypothetical protein